ncbi:hypothetical protein GCM10019017_16620 [Streptomyces showdoensis]
MVTLASTFLEGMSRGSWKTRVRAAGDQGLSPVGAVEGAEDAQQGGLPAAARPEQGDELASPDAQFEAVEDGPVTEDPAQAPYAYGVGHRAPPPPGPAVRQGMRTRSRPRTSTSAVRPSSP